MYLDEFINEYEELKKEYKELNESLIKMDKMLDDIIDNMKVINRILEKW